MTKHRLAASRLVFTALVCAVPALLGGCAGSTAQTTEPPGGTDAAIGTAPVQPLAVTLPALTGRGLDLARYEGARAADPRLAPLLTRIRDAGDGAAALAETTLGRGFRAGRHPLFIVADDEASRPEGPRITRRLVEGVKRAVVRVRTGELLLGRFIPERDVAPLVVRAALLEMSGTDLPPGWVLDGAPPVLTDGLAGLLCRRAVGGNAVIEGVDALFAEDATDAAAWAVPALRAGARVKSLRRIARGERPIGRLLERLRSGDDMDEALKSLGIHDVLLLDAAAETERERMARGLLLDTDIDTLARARAAVSGGEGAEARRVLAEVDWKRDGPGDGSAEDWILSDLALVAAESGAPGADRRLETLFAEPRYVARPHALLWLRLATSDLDEAALTLAVDLLAEETGTRTAERVLRVLGTESSREEIEKRLRAPLAETLGSGDAAARRRLAGVTGMVAGTGASALLGLLARDADPTVRRAALGALAQSDDIPLATRELIRAAADPHPDVRRAALLQLAVVDDERATSICARLAHDPDPAVRRSAVELLKRLTRPAPVTPPAPVKKPSPSQKPAISAKPARPTPATVKPKPTAAEPTPRAAAPKPGAVAPTTPAKTAPATPPAKKPTVKKPPVDTPAAKKPAVKKPQQRRDQQKSDQQGSDRKTDPVPAPLPTPTPLPLPPKPRR